MQNNFSVLMSVYSGESAAYFDQCLESLAVQTLPAAEIVIVKDGVLTKELEQVLSAWREKLPLKIEGYEGNKGLAFALNYGLQFCLHELVARMDSDDICMPDRFEKQINVLSKNSDVCVSSGYIAEFLEDPDKLYDVRKIPLDKEGIIRFSKRRSPFNHVAVIFKKSVVENCGGYSFPMLEDYDLWLTILQQGHNVMNIEDVLVKVRTGNDMIGRRHGLKYAKAEYQLIKKHYKAGSFTFGDVIFLCVFRIPLRLLPKPLLKIVYGLLRSKTK